MRYAPNNITIYRPNLFPEHHINKDTRFNIDKYSVQRHHKEHIIIL